VNAGDYGLLLTTLPDAQAARHIARLLIDERLAACVQLSAIESFYRWDGKIANEPETMLLIKTRTDLFEPAIARIRELHPYTVPEIVGTKFVAGFQGYFHWIDKATHPQENEMSNKNPAGKKPAAPKAKTHPHGDGKISAKKSAGMRTGISRPMRVK
jgi:periplasmic divalent cation tolerance protein